MTRDAAADKAYIARLVATLGPLLAENAALRAKVDQTKQPMGCICPAGAGATCQGGLCPRRPIGKAIA